MPAGGRVDDDGPISSPTDNFPHAVPKPFQSASGLAGAQIDEQLVSLGVGHGLLIGFGFNLKRSYAAIRAGMLIWYRRPAQEMLPILSLSLTCR